MRRAHDPSKTFGLGDQTAPVLTWLGQAWVPKHQAGVASTPALRTRTSAARATFARMCLCVCVCAACHAPLLCALHGRTIFNGNGKLPWELELAVEQGVLINIDSEFDFENIKAAAKKLNKPAKTLLRINPDVDPQVHAYAVVGRKWGRGWLDCCLAPRHWSAGGQNRRVSTTIACSRRGLLLWHRSCVPAIHIRKRAHTHTHTHTCAFTAHSTRMRTMSCVSSLARAPACRCTPTCPPAWPPPSSASATHTSR